MYKILEFLKTSPIIQDYEILDFESGENYYYIKGKINIKNKSTLFFSQLRSENKHRYSYHWQTNDGKLIIRWDNAPHHKQLKTFPHHKHTPKIEESEEITLEKILEYIKKEID